MNQTPEQIRQDQMTAGRTLSLKEGYEVKPRPPGGFHRPKQFGGNKGGHRPQAQTATPKGHDAVLKKAQDEKLIVNITLLSGDKLSGLITGRDKYTIMVREDSEETVIYKHAIELFRVKAAEQVTVQ